jgi:RNA polymerase sigma-70 factor (ECF subfamily)
MAEASGPQQAEDQPVGETLAAPDLPALVQNHHAVVYRYAFRLSANAADAEDLCQQAFLIALRKIHQLRDPERARAWLLAVVRTCYLKELQKRRPVPAQDIDLLVEFVADRTPLLDQVDQQELADAMDELPDEFRLVLLMFYFEDLSYQEIADQLGVPIGTVMSRLSRAKGHLRRQLTPAESTKARAPRPQPLNTRIGNTNRRGVQRHMTP